MSWIGCSSYNKSSLKRHILQNMCRTWDILPQHGHMKDIMILSNSGGKATLQATTPIPLQNLKGPTYRWLCLPFFPNLITSLNGDTLMKTWSPSLQLRNVGNTNTRTKSQSTITYHKIRSKLMSDWTCIIIMSSLDHHNQSFPWSSNTHFNVHPP